jgi:hypothetical protein
MTKGFCDLNTREFAIAYLGSQLCGTESCDLQLIMRQEARKQVNWPRRGANGLVELQGRYCPSGRDGGSPVLLKALKGLVGMFWHHLRLSMLISAFRKVDGANERSRSRGVFKYIPLPNRARKHHSFSMILFHRRETAGS